MAPGAFRRARRRHVHPMRIALATLIGVLAALLALAVGPASGTENRLDSLFDRLKAADDPHAAAPIVRDIWAIWTQPPEGKPEVALLMDAAADHIRHEEYDKALAALDAAIDLAPDHAEAWNRRATAFYRAGDYDAAARDIARTLALEPRHFGALSGLGLINLALGRLPEALKAYEAALAINPHLVSAKRHAEAIRAALKDGGI